MTKFTVDLKRFYETMIKGQWSFEDALNEQPHNTFDNRGTVINLSFYDKDGKKILESHGKTFINPDVMIYKDNCKDHLVNPEKIMKTFSEKLKHAGVGNYNLGEIGSIFNLGTACTYITPSSSFKIEENLYSYWNKS